MTALINFVIIATIGNLSKRFLPKNTGDILTTLIINFTLPMTVFIGITSSQIDLSKLFFVLIGLLGGLLIFWGGKFLIRTLKIEDVKISTVILLAFCGLNIGLFMYPLAEMLWGIESITYFALYDLGNSFIVFGVGKSVAEGKGGKFHIVDLFEFPPFIALILAFLLNGVNLPEFILSPMMVIKDANNFLIMFLVGFYFNIVSLKAHRRILTISVTTKYLLGLIVSLSTLLIPVSTDLQRISLFLSPLLPSAMMAIVYSVKNNYDSELASSFVSLTTLISFIIVFVVTAIMGF
ncbi:MULTISPECIES: AEC family transporter [unclassified Petrotoga]|uniref:AEC family transporter n=1 Tax=unclassified Petrotoga TaxID=2620614 RepID=UPI000EF159A9|nr:MULTISPECIES: AEC family transporter [unclassified Petrotoga]